MNRIWAAAAFCVLVTATARADINLDMYGSVDYDIQSQSQTTNQFGVPKLSFLYTQTYGKLGFLAEPLFEVDTLTTENEFSIDLDRFEITYLVSDWLRLKAGRFHSAVGYYNDAYHHAAIFMPTVDRPTIVEDNGFGLLPGFLVGIHADGRFHLSPTLALHYDVEVANTRGLEPDATQSLFDLQNEKAFNLRLRLELGGDLDGLIIGANLLFNWIPANPAPEDNYNAQTERLYGAHVVYLEHNVHFVSELMWVQHRDRVTDELYEEYGAFAEAGYLVQNFLPFVRYERLHFQSPAGDPFLGELVSTLGSFDAVTAGLKWSFDEHLAAKIAGSVTSYHEHDTAYVIKLQLAAGF